MFRNITVISAYAPTNDKDDQEKESVFDNLEEVCNRIPKHGNNNNNGRLRHKNR